MVFGGTTWGGLPMPTVGTSYDYSAPISEPRTIGDKYSETKLYGFFLRAAKDLTRIEKGGNGTTNHTGNPSVFTDIGTGHGFYKPIYWAATNGIVTAQAPWGWNLWVTGLIPFVIFSMSSLVSL